jgi:hypothetical protein
MTVATPSMDALTWFRKQLEAADADLLREMITTFAGTLMSAEADALTQRVREDGRIVNVCAVVATGVTAEGSGRSSASTWSALRMARPGRPSCGGWWPGGCVESGW